MSDLIIADPLGLGGNARVIGNKLAVLADVESEFEYESEENSASFTWSLTQYDPDAADTLLSIQNQSESLRLHIEDVWFGSDVIAQYQIHVIAAADAITPVGSVALNVCLNRAAIATAPALAKGDETANGTQGIIVWAGTALAETTRPIHWGGALIIEPNGIVAVDIVEAATEGNCTITGYFKKT